MSTCAAGFWYEDRSEMSLEQQEQVKDALIRLEAVFDFHVPDVAEGPSNKDLRFMCHLWEPLRVIHKPLAFVIMMEACTGASSIILCILGFRKYSTPTFTYWAKNVRKPISVPVRFLQCFIPQTSMQLQFWLAGCMQEILENCAYCRLPLCL